MWKEERNGTPHFAKLREVMVDIQLRQRGIEDELVLKAMKKVPREEFLPKNWRYQAYADGPLPIGEGQTISQPYMVALMTESLKLRGGECVLEIGTGSGYAAAILGEIAAEVHTIERLEELSKRAADTLSRLGYGNVFVHTSDGTKGLTACAPFDAIVVAAGGPKVPVSLREQLKVGGRLVILVGEEETSQRLLRVIRSGEDEFAEEILGLVRFVPLIGEEAWRESATVYYRDPALEDVPTLTP